VLETGTHKVIFNLNEDSTGEIQTNFQRTTADPIALHEHRQNQAEVDQFNAGLDIFEATLLAFARAAHKRKLFAHGNASFIISALRETVETVMDQMGKP